MDLYSTKIWVTTFISKNVYGEQVGGYINLREENANVQYMENDIEFKTYGKITNSIIEIRTEKLPKISKGDYIYLQKPSAKGNFTIDGTTYTDYGIGEYIVESVKPNFVGSEIMQNRTTIIAKQSKEQ